MGLFDSYKKADSTGSIGNRKNISENPVVEHGFNELIDEIYAYQDALDDKVHAFLGKLIADDRIVGNFNVNEEWRCWLERDREESRVFFDPELSYFDSEARDSFKACFAEELAAIHAESDRIDKLAQQIDEYKLFKACLFNVFNNFNNLPVYIYVEQVFKRAEDFGMVVNRHSKESPDLVVFFDPLSKINRGGSCLSYQLYMRFNQNHKKDCYVYAACMMDTVSSDVMNSETVNLPIYNAFSKFSKETDAYFIGNKESVFYQQSLKSHRKKEKERFGIPADYFEGTFVDPAKLVDFSDKSYQYGNSKIFIPKSQIAFAGDKVYMKRWLYAKLKRPVEQFEANLRKEANVATLDEKVASAAAQAAVAQPAGSAKGYKRDSAERG